MSLESHRIGLCVCFFLLIFPLFSKAQTTEETFNQGVAAFKKGLYPSALDFFLQAERAGMENGRLYYNLAAIYYKQENYAAAYSAFAKATADKDLATTAYFNMALCAYKQADLELAKENFQQSYNTANTSVQRKQALYMASKAGISLTVDQVDNWISVVKTTVGKNGNVILIDDERTINAVDQIDEGDEFISLFASISKNISENVKLSLSNYILEYDEINSRDFTNFSLKTNYKIDYKNWGLELEAEFENNYIDSDKYQQNSGIVVKVLYHINNRFSLDSRLWLRNIESKDEGYDYLGGKMQQLELSSNFSSRSFITKMFIGYEWNDREGVMLNDVLVDSYSPERVRIGFSNMAQFANKSLFGVSLIYRESKYPVVEISDPISRKTERYQLSASYHYPLDEHWRIIGEYGYLDSDSNDKDFRYNSSIYTLSIMWK